MARTVARRALALREGRPPAWDRLLAMVFFVALLHGLVILGITFNAQAGDDAGAPGLKVLLVSDELPEAAENASASYLAQRTQLGSGSTREPVAPHSPPTALPALKHPGSPQGDSLAARGDMKGAEAERVLTTTAWVTDVRYLADLGATGSERDRPLLIDEPRATQPGPADEPGPAQLTGPKRDELWVTADTRAASLAPYLDSLKSTLGQLQQATMWLMQNAMKDPDNGAAASYDYMHLFGLTALSYMWTRIVKAVHARQAAGTSNPAVDAKPALARFFFARILPEAGAHLTRIVSGADTLMEFSDTAF